MKCAARNILAMALATAAFVAPSSRLSGQSATADARVWTPQGPPVSSLAISPDGTRLAAGATDGTLRLWDTASSRILRTLRGPDAELYALGFASDGQLVLTTGDKGVVTIFEAGSGRKRGERSGLKGWSADLACSSDGRSVAAWGHDGRILIWDVAEASPPRVLEGDAGKWGQALAWSPDGRTLAAGRGTIALWDIAQGTRIAALSGHTDFVRGLAFSPDGRLLASAGLDKTVRVWDVRERRQLYVLEPSGFAHASLKGPVVEPIRVPFLAVRFSPDGKILATAGADRFVRLWEAGTGNLLQTLQGAGMTITAVIFSPDAGTVYSAGLDGVVRSWTVR